MLQQVLNNVMNRKEAQMPFCPNCKTEYVAGIVQCSDCRIALVDHLPEEQSIEYEDCENCFESVTAESEFCVHCGVLLSEDDFFLREAFGIKGNRRLYYLPAIDVQKVCEEKGSKNAL